MVEKVARATRPAEQRQQRRLFLLPPRVPAARSRGGPPPSPGQPPPSSPCVPLSDADLQKGLSKCATEFADGRTLACKLKPTKKERKQCNNNNEAAGIACDAALYCPPDRTTS